MSLRRTMDARPKLESRIRVYFWASRINRFDDVEFYPSSILQSQRPQVIPSHGVPNSQETLTGVHVPNFSVTVATFRGATVDVNYS